MPFARADSTTRERAYSTSRLSVLRRPPMSVTKSSAPNARATSRERQ